VVLHDVINNRFARKAVEKGADGLIAVAAGAGGHAGVKSPFALVQEIRQWFDGPLALSGSIATGGAVLAAQAMGADFAYVGSAFIATTEAPVHQNVKDAIVAASELDTRLVMRPLRNTERVLRNVAVDRLLEKEKNLGADLKFEDIMDEVAGVYPRIMQDGTMDAGAWSCGMVAGLIHDIPSVKVLIDRIMQEADTIISKRLSTLIRC
jgi:nitronate monooxygenase